ncbi:hypothetical protein VTN49DRAFT_4198 [Thermomyces lanuginosus]|uniref:uncharacterized protein n=1 Tax=Thermomyces lanuginosus TaxID=5541 RepID=UPI0037442D6D
MVDYGGNFLSSGLPTPTDTSTNTSRRSSESLNLWTRAYMILQNREPALMVDYKKYLASLQDGAEPLQSTSVESIVSRLVQDHERRQ